MKKQEPSIFTADEFQALQKTKRKSSKKEESIQMAVCEYIRTKYPDVIFMCDLASGMKLPIWIAAKHKKMRSSRALPDLFIAKRSVLRVGSVTTSLYYGLFIELKQESVRLKNGSIARSPHHDEQAEILARLRQLGYRAEFCCGYTEAVTLIDEYLSN